MTSQKELIPVSSQKPGLPESILYYLKKNANPRLLFKFMQISKYFCFQEFPFFALQRIAYSEEKCLYLPLKSDVKKLQRFNINAVGKKLWITKSASICSFSSTKIASEIIPKIAVCDISSLFLQNQRISLDELKFFVNDNLKSVWLNETIVFDDDMDGKSCLIQKILVNLPNLSDFSYNFQDNFTEQFDADSTKNIMKSLKTSKIRKLLLMNIPEMFEIDAFFKFMKENPQIRYTLYFGGVTKSYERKLRAYVDQVDYTSYPFPISLNFPGFNSRSKLGFGIF